MPTHRCRTGAMRKCQAMNKFFSHRCLNAGLILPAIIFILSASAAGAREWKMVDPAALSAWVKSEQITLVNVMSRIECLDHQIKGSRCIACEEFNGHLSTIPRDRKLVLYCESETCTRSCLAADEAVRAGMRDVYVLKGGMPAWKGAGFNLQSAQRIPRMPVSSVKADELMAWHEHHPEYSVLDIRSRDRFLEGHLEGAFNIPLYQLHNRYHELPHDRALLVVDDQGFRSFLAASYLTRKGFQVVRLFGGMAAWKAFSEGTRQVR